MSYAPGRSGKHGEKLLEGFEGTVQVGGYSGHNRLDRLGGALTPAACWTRARRGSGAPVVVSAQPLGLSGPMDSDTFKAVLEDRVPNGPHLGKRGEDGEKHHRPGRDVSMSAAKSVSLMAMVGGDERIVEAQDRAVGTTLGWIETPLSARVCSPKASSTVPTGTPRSWSRAISPAPRWPAPRNYDVGDTVIFRRPAIPENSGPLRSARFARKAAHSPAGFRPETPPLPAVARWRTERCASVGRRRSAHGWKVRKILHLHWPETCVCLRIPAPGGAGSDGAGS